MAAARSVRRRRSAESANSRNTALREVPRRVASASTSLRRSSGIDTMTFAMIPSIPWYTIEALMDVSPRLGSRSVTRLLG